MKRQFAAFLLLLSALAAQAQEPAEEGRTEADIGLNPRTGFPEITAKPFLMFDEGFSFAQITRISKQEERSNFVWQDYLIGAHFDIMTENFKPVDLMLRVAAYYPFYHTFNGMRQYPKQVVLYAFDLFTGPVIQANMWNYVRLNLAAGLHYMYQLTDEYHLHYLGAGAVAGVELPIAWHWTILLDATAALDYPNFGTNRNIQPYNYAWQYQASLGVRYSKKGANMYSYISSKKRARQLTILEQATIEIDAEEARRMAAADGGAAEAGTQADAAEVQDGGAAGEAQEADAAPEGDAEAGQQAKKKAKKSKKPKKGGGAVKDAGVEADAAQEQQDGGTAGAAQEADAAQGSADR
ncbi:MAG: hypothetical protein K2H09_04940 [Treponemataceae bacterium]|nr:hypothetical protein [Treponemataceae bacterium]